MWGKALYIFKLSIEGDFPSALHLYLFSQVYLKLFLLPFLLLSSLFFFCRINWSTCKFGMTFHSIFPCCMGEWPLRWRCSQAPRPVSPLRQPHGKADIHQGKLAKVTQWNSCKDEFLTDQKQLSSVQLLGHVWLSATPWTAARQASLFITNSWSLLKQMQLRVLPFSLAAPQEPRAHPLFENRHVCISWGFGMSCPRAADRTGCRVLSLPEDVLKVQEVACGGLPATSQLCCVQKSQKWTLSAAFAFLLWHSHVSPGGV